MTREETISILEESKRQNEIMRDNPSTFWASHQMADGVKNAERRIAALDIALSALRPVSRERVEKVWRGKWIGMTDDDGCTWYECSRCEHDLDSLEEPNHFCPACGAPMTDEAVDMMMERLEAMKDG